MDVGRTARPGRRALGLLREELAELAGLSVDYVVRLEQGRATSPSAQVVASQARALQLGPMERDHAYRLAGLLPPQEGTISTHVPAGVQRMLARLDEFPVGVFSAERNLMRVAFAPGPSGLAAWLATEVARSQPTLRWLLTIGAAHPPAGGCAMEALEAMAQNRAATARDLVDDIQHRPLVIRQQQRFQLRAPTGNCRTSSRSHTTSNDQLLAQALVMLGQVGISCGMSR
ncbi:helix-turn-helix domain-containing protein [Streptomyces sp. MB09-02B]|uniref:helix-turn-helix domain-containing protein n=1 Tax=Streptomyces sp. MB09-02B TaxID=3028667 RepID=UPI0039AF0E8F